MELCTLCTNVPYYYLSNKNHKSRFDPIFLKTIKNSVIRASLQVDQTQIRAKKIEYLLITMTPLFYSS